MADEKKPLEAVAQARAGRQVENAGSGAAGGGGSDGERSVKKTRRTRKPQSKAKKYEDILPVDTFREYTDQALDGVSDLANLTPASEVQKKAIASSGRNVFVKRVGASENLDEIMLCLVLCPLAIRWTFEGLGKLFAKGDDEKQAHTDPGPERDRKILSNAQTR